MPRRYSKRFTPEERFWAKVKRADDLFGCWEWMGCRMPHGHGQMTIDDKRVLVHRFAWILHNGPIPDGLHVCHHCDNGWCVRPEHLFLGTHQDNMADRDRKGRTFNGQSAKTHCKRGHPLTAENIYAYRGGRHRHCRICQLEDRSTEAARLAKREYDRQRRLKIKQQQNAT